MTTAFERAMNYIGQAPGDAIPYMPRASEYKKLLLGIGSVSYEEAIFLYGLATIMKPDRIWDMGTLKGATALIFAAACVDAGKGTVITVDIDYKQSLETKEWATAQNWPIEWRKQEALTYFQNTPIEAELKYLVFVDTGDTRIEELTVLLNEMPTGTIIAVHDTNDEPGLMKRSMRLERRFPHQNMVKLPSPRGLTVLEV